jgi:mannose-6-phosphate isomerase-like protein (cupin superfamily)
VGAEHEAHAHKNAEEYIIIVKGRGLQTSGGEEFEVGPGDIIFVPEGELHLTKNLSSTEPLELYFVYAGAASLEKAGYKRS